MKKVFPYLVVLLGLVVIAGTHGLRHYYGGNMMGAESHYHARVAEEIMTGSYWDKMAYGGRPILLDPYSHLLAASGFVMPIRIASVLLPLLLGLSSSLLFFYFLRLIGFQDNERFFATIIFITSPIFINIFVLSSSEGMAVFLLLTAGVLILKKSLFTSLVSGIALGILCFFGPVYSALALLGVVVLGIYSGQKKRMYFVGSIVIAVAVAVQLIPNTYSTLPMVFTKPPFIREILSVFGGDKGFSIFAIFLAVAGTTPCWKSRRYFIYPILALITVSYLFGSNYNIFLNLLICGLAAYGLKALIDRRWELKIVRDLTVFVLGLGMLFVLVSYSHQLASGMPNPELIESLSWLAQNTKPQEVVLSSDENGFWIEYYARRPVVLDSRTAGVPQAFQVYNDTRAVFASRNLKEATDLLRKYKVRYILIDSQMRPLLMNEKRQEGLSFLLRNSERFKKEKEYSNIEIWQFFG